MKKLLKHTVVAIFALALLLVGTPASAQQATCEVGYTGPDTQNICTSTTDYRCTVTNTNTVEIISENEQEAFSGSVTVNRNTTGGGAVSGTATNSSGVVFNIVITNPSSEPEEGEDYGTCFATSTVPATIPPTPVVPVSNEEPAPVEALPVTSGAPLLATFAMVAAATALLAAISIGAVYVYRRLKA